MNNEWNDEVVVDVSESDITVDQTYDATSSNPQSGTAVAQAVAQAGGPVDQHFNASSTNAQSGKAVAEGIYLNRPLTTTQASQTEIDVDVKGDAPIKLIAEDYGTEAGPSVAATFKVARVRTSGLSGVEVIFDLPAIHRLPINAQLTIAEDISGSDPNKYYLDSDSYFAIAVNDTINLNGQYSPMSFRTADTDHHKFLAGTYNIAITSGSPYLEFSQVGITFNGSGAPGAWDEIRDYIIANASTLFSLSLPSTIKTARLLPASTSSDADKVLTVNASGKPAWAPAASGGVPVLHSLSCQVSKGWVWGEFPEGEYLEPGLYQVFIRFAMSEYNASYRHITYGYQAEGSEWLSEREYYPVGVDANGPFSSSQATFVRTGYIKVRYPDEVSGLDITFTNGTSLVTGSDVLNHVSVQYMKVADLS